MKTSLDKHEGFSLVHNVVSRVKPWVWCEAARTVDVIVT